jgi:hypothetical protein
MRPGDPSCLEATVGYFGQNVPYSEYFGFYDFCDSNAPDGFYGMTPIAGSSSAVYENTYDGQTTIDYQILYSFTDQLWHGYLFNFAQNQWEDVFDAGGTCTSNPAIATPATPGGCNLEGGTPNGGWDMSETHFSGETRTNCPTLPNVASYNVEVDTLTGGWTPVAANPSTYNTNNNLAGTFYWWGDCSLVPGDQTVAPPYYALTPQLNNTAQPAWSFATVTSVPSIFAPAIGALAPTAYYRMNETSGIVVADSSGHGYNATLEGPSYVKEGAPAICCSPDTSYAFSSMRSYIVLPATLPFTPKYTVTAVVKSASYGQTLGATCLFDYRGQCLSINANYVGWGPFAGPFSHVAWLQNGQSYFLALAVDTTTAPYTAQVSVDGGPFVNANPSGLKPAVTGSSNINLFYYPNIPMSGLGEVALFPAVLSTQQVASLASTAGFPVPTPTPGPSAYGQTVLNFNPLAYYRMNETSGLVVTDSAAHGYNGTIQGPSYVKLGQPGLCCNYDTSYGFTSARAYITLPATLPFSTKYTIATVVNSSYYGQNRGATCLVDYWSQCLTVDANFLGWGPLDGPYSHAIPLTNGKSYLAILTVDTTVSPYAVSVTAIGSVDGGTPVVANTYKLKPAATRGSDINLNYYVNQPISTMQGVAIFPYILTPAQMQALIDSAILN